MPEAISLDSPLAIVGDEDVVLGFRSLGFKTYPFKESDEIQNILDEVLKTKASICLVQDNIYAAAKAKIDDYKGLPFPIFIPFSKDGKTDLLKEIIRHIRIRATGAF